MFVCVVRYLRENGTKKETMCVQSRYQTSSTGVRHPSFKFNYCRIYTIGSRKLSANEQFFLLVLRQ